IENGCKCFGWEASVRRARRAPARRHSVRAAGKRLSCSARPDWPPAEAAESERVAAPARPSGQAAAAAPIVAVLAAAGQRQTPSGLRMARGPRRAAAVLPARSALAVLPARNALAARRWCEATADRRA